MPTNKIADQTFEEIPVAPEPVEKKYFIIWLLGGGLVILVIVLSILVNLFKKPAVSPKPPSLPVSTPTPFEEKITSPSIYATDSAILKIEAELKTIDQDLQSTDLKEAGLNPPVLDMEVNLEEK